MSELPKPSYIGKVRDVYDLGNSLILSSTDRISAFDVVFRQIVPGKGKVLNKISAEWFSYFKDIPNHIIETDVSKFPSPFKDHPDLKDRSVLVKKCKRIDFECVVRGYLSGSGWKEYKQEGTLAFKKLPPGLQESEKLPEPAFTPAIKNDTGHDENISEERMKNEIGSELFSILKEKSISLYTRAAELVAGAGILLCDTKFEFGIWEDKVILIDEILTPDSSRYWAKESYIIGTTPPSMDKQILRNYLEKSGWNKVPPPPDLPESLIVELQAAYKEIQDRLLKCLSQESM
ncbi:phosphoribosylaminoimidazolesuccinocarboxamide synthase [Leptospira licerasiae]|uniref:Phosphoribosylaminoimidazole-succinocarboxamide synthase n=1 Tax=Leptospira licerasiae str. MMD4847 TaxID=1049971 RepID=A0ABN0H736_9LEPT|nr:phosphoribosylaminoimidazolesuccinocarboxamide synthase [Leptospira licerasiae]EID99714.1 phosphoribosylaminoimidazolesuccinocarboxamide synthase [Leptospira licerasiae serovar Varillal str. VAR 010]EJZ41544.1 phosphoribosylaminoimidazolesuccinocarboxamide synthase [Leptospira licerasiae str. MMD4847]